MLKTTWRHKHLIWFNEKGFWIWKSKFILLNLQGLTGNWKEEGWEGKKWTEYANLGTGWSLWEGKSFCKVKFWKSVVWEKWVVEIPSRTKLIPSRGNGQLNFQKEDCTNEL